MTDCGSIAVSFFASDLGSAITLEVCVCVTRTRWNPCGLVEPLAVVRKTHNN